MHPFRKPPQAEVDAELAFHLEQRVRDYVARGMDPAEARAAALARFGDVTTVRTECTQLLEADRRAADRRDWLDDLRQDLRYGLRALRRAPLFTLLAVVTLALGIGANAAVFGVVKSVLLDALPYASADRLTRTYGKWASGMTERGPLSVGTIRDLRERARSFARLAAFESQPREAAMMAGGDPRVVKVLWAEPELFRTLGVAAGQGRLLRPEDAESDTAFHVVLTHAAWQRHFGGDPTLVGGTVRVDGITRTVVGVLPRGFVGPEGAVDFYFPLGLRAALRDPGRAYGRQSYGLVGRRLPVLLMTAFGALALLLASVGVYAMFASMAAAREREFGVRLALGSRPRDIAALVLRQGGAWMALGLAVGAAGIALVSRLLRGLLYGVAPFDPVALGIAVALLVVCAAVALLAPVRRATRVDPISALR